MDLYLSLFLPFLSQFVLSESRIFSFGSFQSFSFFISIISSICQWVFIWATRIWASGLIDLILIDSPDNIFIFYLFPEPANFQRSAIMCAHGLTV